MRIQIRRGSAADWGTLDPVLLLGEQGLETDSNKVKMGDGVSRWSQLPWHVPFTIGEGLDEDMDTGAISVNTDTTDAISASLTQEVADRQAADTQEAADRLSGDEALGVRIDEVEADILAADTTLQSNIDSESDARSLADEALGVRIDTEITDRQTADGALDSKIDELEQGTTASLEALEIDAYNYAKAQAQDAYDNAIAHADAADDLLSGRLGTLEADPVTKTDAYGYAKEQAEDAYGNAIAHADAADGLLSGRLDTLEADPVTKTDAYGYAKEQAEDAYGNAVSSAEAYTDSQILIAQSDYEAKDAVVKSEAKDYTDAAVADLATETYADTAASTAVVGLATETYADTAASDAVAAIDYTGVTAGSASAVTVTSAEYGPGNAPTAPVAPAGQFAINTNGGLNFTVFISDGTQWIALA